MQSGAELGFMFIVVDWEGSFFAVVSKKGVTCINLFIN